MLFPVKITINFFAFVSYMVFSQIVLPVYSWLNLIIEQKQVVKKDKTVICTEACSQITAPLVKLLEDFGGLSPSSNAKLLNIFLKLSTVLLISKLISLFVYNARVVPTGVVNPSL